LIKLDLEGAEYEALLGARELLAEVRPDMIVEVEPGHLARQGASAGSLFSLLKGHGYDFYRVASSSREGLSLARVGSPSSTRESPNVFATTNLERARQRGVWLAE
jgi:hypothetical protein